MVQYDDGRVAVDGRRHRHPADDLPSLLDRTDGFVLDRFVATRYLVTVHEPLLGWAKRQGWW